MGVIANSSGDVDHKGREIFHKPLGVAMRYDNAIMANARMQTDLLEEILVEKRVQTELLTEIAKLLRKGE